MKTPHQSHTLMLVTHFYDQHRFNNWVLTSSHSKNTLHITFIDDMNFTMCWMVCTAECDTACEVPAELWQTNRHGMTDVLLGLIWCFEHTSDKAKPMNVIWRSLLELLSNCITAFYSRVTKKCHLHHTLQLITTDTMCNTICSAIKTKTKSHTNI